MEDKNTAADHDDTTETLRKKSKQASKFKRLLSVASALAGSVLIIAISYIGYLYIASPLDIRQPLYEHYHFRMSLNVNGRELNFAEPAYQQGYSKDNCNATLTAHPIHFHDNKNHFVHIHWEGMTGGQVLKYYGWNYIGGIKGSLGYRFDSGAMLKKVPIHSNTLPTVPDGDAFYVYTGNAEKYSGRLFTDFTGQDLEKFFNKDSNSPAHRLNQQKRSSLMESLVPRTYAHDTEEHAAKASDSPSAEQLERLNNLIGDVVIFVQKEKPSDDQIKQRFESLTPLSESTCAG